MKIIIWPCNPSYHYYTITTPGQPVQYYAKVQFIHMLPLTLQLDTVQSTFKNNKLINFEIGFQYRTGPWISTLQINIFKSFNPKVVLAPSFCGDNCKWLIWCRRISSTKFFMKKWSDQSKLSFVVVLIEFLSVHLYPDISI